MSSCVLYHGDCLEIMPKIKPDSVSLLFADLPYQCTSAKWDVAIDLKKMWQLLGHLSAGPYIFTAQQPFLTDLINSQRKKFRYDLVWQKNRYAGFMSASKAPLRAHETIAIFGETKTYNAQKTDGHKPYHVTSGKNPHISTLNGAVATTKNGDTSRFPLSVQKFARDDVRNGQGHPTQKPVALLEWLIASYSNAGDTVLDPVFGSATTAVACARLGRHFIGIEKDPEYFRIGVERVNAERAKLGFEPCEIR